MGHEVTGQSDVYSLGIVLYEMLTGEVPFKGESSVSVAMKHVREGLPDVQRRRPEVSAALAAVVERATAKELRNRYASMADLVARPRGGADLRDRPRRRGDGRGDRRAQPAAGRAPRGTAPAAAPARWRSLLRSLIAARRGGRRGVADRRRRQRRAARARSRDLSPIPLGEPRRRRLRPAARRRRGEPREQRRSPSTATRPPRGRPRTTTPPTSATSRTASALYLDAGRPVVARALRIITPKTGWDVELYVANQVPDRRRAAGPRSAAATIDAHPQDARPRHRRPALPLLPGLDHAARGKPGRSLQRRDLGARAARLSCLPS